jgi:nucleoid-associated protein YgaU
LAGDRSSILILIFSILLMSLVCAPDLYAQIREDEVDFSVLAVVTFGRSDSLWNLAERYYQDPWLWPIIAYVNRISDITDIPAGTAIYIPHREAKRPTNRTIIAELSAEIQGLRREIEGLKNELERRKLMANELAAEITNLKAKLLRASEEREALETRNKQLIQALRDRDDLARELEQREAVAGELAAEIARLRAELLSINQERETHGLEDEQVPETLSDEQVILESPEPPYDMIATRSEKTTPPSEVDQVKPVSRTTVRNASPGKPKGSSIFRWQYPLAFLMMATTLVIGLTRIF